MNTIGGSEAVSLVEREEVLVLDVRTPGEYARLGHIPGAWLLPVDLVASAPAVLPQDGRTVLVCCEHGIRSAAAVRFLEQAGVTDVLNLAGGMAVWTGPRAHGPGIIRGPSPWLLEHASLLPAGGRVLDVAAGRGRHALLMAAAGFPVTAIDRDAEALAFLRDTAARLALAVDIVEQDLEGDPVELGDAAFDVALVFHYLHRPLLPAIVRALAPGGLLFYETFTAGQAARGRPSNPDFLLRDGELPSLVEPLEIVASREGEIDGALKAAVVARRT
ncbi:MAG: rhodanese-like domain-containing protein [Vicinamibacterales bacterium]